MTNQMTVSRLQQYVEDLPNEGQHEVVRISNYKDFQMIDKHGWKRQLPESLNRLCKIDKATNETFGGEGGKKNQLKTIFFLFKNQLTNNNSPQVWMSNEICGQNFVSVKLMGDVALVHIVIAKI